MQAAAVHAEQAREMFDTARDFNAGAWPRDDVANAYAKAQWHATMAVYESVRLVAVGLFLIAGMVIGLAVT